MPIPVITDHFAAQVILKGKSGQPSDVYTNTFYFRNDGTGGSVEGVATDLAASLEAFYNDNPGNVTGAAAPAGFLSSSIIETQAEVRVYDLGDPAPRYPKLRYFTLTGMAATVLPSEVAVCLSYVAGENQPRNRGRVYIGPLANSATTTSNGRAQVSGSFQLGLLGAAKNMIDGNVYGWMLYSPTDQQMKEITGAWTDNAFDTQRRRGEEATARYTIGTYQGQSGTPAPPIA